MKKKDAEFIWKKLEEWTRCEIMAHLGRFENLEYANYYKRKLEIEDEIRKFLFGSDSLIDLAYQWKMISRTKKKVKKNSKKILKKTKKHR